MVSLCTLLFGRKGATAGEVLKPDAHSDLGFLSETVTLDDIRRWENAGGAPDEEFERYFRRDDSKGTTSPIHTSPESAEQIDALLQTAIDESRALSQEVRRNRLENADPVPCQLQVRTSVFLRNADVIVEVLERAAGRCEACEVTAPFRRASDGSPYLEVHHIIPLARGGHDTVANAQALCPNCHRRIHFGSDVT